jgi:hypothetical protein
MTDLLSTEEFSKQFVHMDVSDVLAAYAAALEDRDHWRRRYDLKHDLYETIVTVICEEWFVAFATLTAERDAALARVAERDTLAAELAELREAVTQVVDGNDCVDAPGSCGNPICDLRVILASQPQGARGKAWVELLQYARKATANHPYDRDFTCHLCMVRQAVDRLTAIDGAQ